MWTRKQNSIGGHASFFLVGLSHNSLVSYYQTNFALMQHHKYSLTEIDNMVPWEREVYLSMLTEWLKEQKQEAERQNGNSNFR